MRRSGITILLITHAGKTAKGSRGTSGQEDNVDVVIEITPSKDRVSDGCSFSVKFTKHRQRCKTQKLIDDQVLKFLSNHQGNYE